MNRIRKPLSVLLALALALWPITASATDDLWDYDASTPGNNVSIGGVSFAENMPPGNVNDGVRMLIAQLKRAVANKGSDIASASTASICATGTSAFVHITGTTTITAFGTAAAGCTRFVVFDGILTLTHNATSLILPGGANITTAANDAMVAVSEGSGNWRVVVYTTAAGGVVGGFSSLTATSTDAGATAGPDIKAMRDSASPADNDLIGRLLFNGRDESSNEDTYASVEAQILDATGATEDALLMLKTVVAGTLAARVSVGQGVQVGSPTGGDQGAGTINADNGIYKDGVLLSSGTVIYHGRDTNATYTTLGTIMPNDDTGPVNTEGDEVLSLAVTPRSASSTLRIRAVLNIGGASSAQVGCALFVDATAASLSANSGVVGISTAMDQMEVYHEVSAASTSARTYKIRCGAGAATDAFLNGDNSTRVFGGRAVSYLTVEEILP